MTPRLVLVACALVAAPTWAQDATCQPDAGALGTLLRTDYAGRGLLDGPDGAQRARALDSLLARAGGAADGPTCDRLLHEATALFPDGHLEVLAPTPSENVRGGVRRFAPWAGELGIRYLGDRAAVLRVRSFGLDDKPAIDSLLAAHAERLRATPYLVVDVTTNGGGRDTAFEALLPLLYTGPVRLPGAEIAATPANRAAVAEAVADLRLDAVTRASLARLVERMNAAPPGAFVAVGDADEPALTDGEPLPLPRAVAVLTDAATASTAEEFVLTARQSAKVVVVGAPTAGALDYSSVRAVELPSGTRALRLPMTRRDWPPGGAVDATGIAPDVEVPDGVQDWVAFALGVLAARDAAAGTQP